ncbi:hypothetical protein H8356DRAFT_1280402 [Neocallimastix lanati (nom. inval.)]|nr:hypothetical protein H8356DRAFT_1280402 [Neocallimastix sp. JGI-2020a]
MVSSKITFPSNDSRNSNFKNDVLMDKDNDIVKEEEQDVEDETIAHNYINIPNYQFGTQDSYESQTQTQTQKFTKDQWALIKPVNYPQGKEFYLTLPEKVFYFGRNIKNSHYVIPGIFVSSKHFKISLKENELTNENYVELGK